MKYPLGVEFSLQYHDNEATPSWRCVCRAFEDCLLDNSDAFYFLQECNAIAYANGAKKDKELSHYGNTGFSRDCVELTFRVNGESLISYFLFDKAETAIQTFEDIKEKFYSCYYYEED